MANQLIERLYMETTSGAVFELCQVPSMVSLAGLLSVLPLSELSPLINSPPKLLTMLQRGDQKKLLLSQSLREADISNEDYLRIVPDEIPECLVQLYVSGGCPHGDFLRAGLTPKIIPDNLPRESFVSRALRELANIGHIAEVVVLAGMQWQDNPEIAALMGQLTLVYDQPASAAPRAWRCMLPDDQAKLKNAWPEFRRMLVCPEFEQWLRNHA